MIYALHRSSASLEVISPSSIQQKCVFVDVCDGNSYVVKFPCAIRMD